MPSNKLNWGQMYSFVSGDSQFHLENNRREEAFRDLSLDMCNYVLSKWKWVLQRASTSQTPGYLLGKLQHNRFGLL